MDTAAMSNYLKTALVNHAARVASWTMPSGLYVALFDGTLSLAGTGATEITGGSYTRQAVTFATAAVTYEGIVSTATAASTGAVSFEGLPACTIGAHAIWDAASGGHPLWIVNLDDAVTVPVGSTYRAALGAIEVALS